MPATRRLQLPSPPFKKDGGSPPPPPPFSEAAPDSPLVPSRLSLPLAPPPSHRPRSPPLPCPPTALQAPILVCDQCHLPAGFLPAGWEQSESFFDSADSSSHAFEFGSPAAAALLREGSQCPACVLLYGVNCPGRLGSKASSPEFFAPGLSDARLAAAREGCEEALRKDATDALKKMLQAFLPPETAEDALGLDTAFGALDDEIARAFARRYLQRDLFKNDLRMN